jgi:hypothetical protein
MTRPDKPERRVMFTTNGMEVPLLAVSETYIAAARAHAAADFRARGEPIDPPTYEVRLAGGTVEKYPHDEKTLKVLPDRQAADPVAAAIEADRLTAVNEAGWLAHVAAVKRLEQAQSAASTRAMLELGMDLDLPTDERWMARQRRAHVDIPEDLDDRRYHWLTTEVLVSFDDLMTAIQIITELTYKGALKEEDIAAAMATFRSGIQRHAAGVIAASQQRSALALQRAAGGVAGGEGMAPDALGVPEPAVPGSGRDGGGGADDAADAGAGDGREPQD